MIVMNDDPVHLLFDRYKLGQLAHISELIETQAEETEILDFKEVSRGKAPMLDDDKRNLSKALSGFANGIGGILVWGVSAKSMGKDLPDVAYKLHPIENLQRMYTDLLNLSPQLVSPPLSGIEYAVIEDSTKADAGFIVMYIPRSDGEPHRATDKNLNQYFLRSGSSFIPMTHTMLADRFSRRSQPKLQLNWRFSGAGTMSTSSEKGTLIRTSFATIILELTNFGKRVAVYPAVAIDSSPTFELKHLERSSHSISLQRIQVENDRHVFTGASDFVLHPTLKVPVAELRLELTKDFCLSIPYESFCDGPSLTGICVIPRSEILERHENQSIRPGMKTKLWVE
jgi:hypothetical protein